MSGEWTYHLQDARTLEWLSRDLPLQNVEITDVLTGHNSITGDLVPEDDVLDDLVEEWGTFLFAEKGDSIRSGGILTTSRLTDSGNALSITVEGFTRYADGQSYGGKFRLWSADPLDCLRHIWWWLQQRSASSDLNLVLDDTTSTVVISDVEPPPRPKRPDVTYGPMSPYGDPGDPWERPPKPHKPNRRKPTKRSRRQNEEWVKYLEYLEWFEEQLEAYQAEYLELNKGKLKPWRAWKGRLRRMRAQWVEDYGDREPYKLSWWEETDCGQEAQRLAQEGEFEWRERHTWNVDRSNVNHRLLLGWPTLGEDKSETITLDIADELVDLPEAEHGGERYANRVNMLGAGEGRKTKRATAVGDDSRLRREITLPAKRVKRIKRLQRLANEERSYRKLMRHIEEVQVWDNGGNLGDLHLGDTIGVAITGTFWKSGTTRHRIVGRRYRPDDDSVIYLQLVRAERTPA